MPSLLRTWLQLFRAPNLFTVPGDPLVGYLLACIGTTYLFKVPDIPQSVSFLTCIIWLAGNLLACIRAVEPVMFLPIFASLCFYAGGLLLNDLVDLREDEVERPKRPLPSGAANPVTVGMVMVLLFLSALMLCFIAGAWSLRIGGLLLGAILAYNLICKPLPIAGALNMGLCRGLSVLLGSTVVPHGELSIPLMMQGRLNQLAVVFLIVTFYIAAVTHLARFETKNAAPVFARWLPAAVMAAGWVTFFPMVGGDNRLPTFVLFLLAFVINAAGGESSRRCDTPLPAVIGQLIRSLLVLQAAFCAATGPCLGYLSAALLILCWPVSRAIGQRFYGS